jgi:hypothetical protein
MIAYVTMNSTYLVEDLRCVHVRSHAGKRARVPAGATLVVPPRLGDPLVFFIGERRVVTTEVRVIAAA